ncbi:MAG TPA: ATP-binding protein, partial [Candidatus Wallbacteria bacterium]|nr:ATP-binding protein [Candidatus Wallbacteria bacterium]
TVLEAKLNSWRLEKSDENHKKQIGELNRKLSYNLSAFEFTSEIACAVDEKNIAQKIIYLFDSLFAPCDIFYYSLEGAVINWVMTRNRQITQCEKDRQFKGILESADKMAADGMTCLPCGEGFKVFIGAPGEKQGLAVIENLKFPRYINNYMELAESVADISSIAISNARKYEKIEAAVEEARKASSVKSSFLANMSHELRTPISSIIGFCDLAHSKEASAETREFIGYIKTSSRILLSLVNNILDFSKIEAGGLEIENADFSLGDTVRQAAGMVKVQADAKKVNLEHCVPEPDRMLTGDAFKLRQVLLNLLSNAVKFSDRGTVFIEARTVKDEGESVQITFSVKDEGIGIEESKKDIIFKPFSQADGSVSRKFGGTGLGLSISESFVKLMGGREICVESSPGRGSRFYFTLEFKKAQKKPAAAKIEDASASIPAQRSIMDQGGEKYKILVVDDNLINLELMKRIIDKSGHVSSGADSGEAALRLLEGDAFDLIIMDLQMPVMDGLETSTAIRGRNIITPIIAVSATTIERCAEKCSAAGIDAFVQKPVGFQSLKDIIQKYAAGRKKNAADLS